MRVLLLTLLTAAAAFAAGPPAPPAVTGKVVPAKMGDGMTLVTARGEAYPLVKDDVTRLFFEDPDTRGRPMRLYGRVREGGLQVQLIHSLKDGKPHEVFYWCERCQLRYAGPGRCYCCGEETELREVPVK